MPKSCKLNNCDLIAVCSSAVKLPRNGGISEESIVASSSLPVRVISLVAVPSPDTCCAEIVGPAKLSYRIKVPAIRYLNSSVAVDPTGITALDFLMLPDEIPLISEVSDHSGLPIQRISE